jgi:hypothetical protein
MRHSVSLIRGARPAGAGLEARMLAERGDAGVAVSVDAGVAVGSERQM